MEVEKGGFKKLIQPDVVLHVQDALTLSSAQETAIVEANALDAGTGSMWANQFFGGVPLP